MRRSLLVSLSVGVLVMTCLSVVAPASASSGGDGTRIYWSHFFDPNSGTARLTVSDSRGHDVRVLTHPPLDAQDIDPQVAPDGRHVLFERDFPDGTTQLRIIGANGHGEHALPLGCADPCAADLTPTWSPDGHRVVFTRVMGPFDQPNDSASSAVLWRSDLSGKHLTRLSQKGIDGAYEDYRATFAPAGYVVFIRVRNSDIRSAAFRMNSDGSHVHRLTPWDLDADTLSVSPAASGPSKDLVVFETYGHEIPDGKTSAVATVSARDRSHPDSLSGIRFLTSTTSTPTHNYNPAWSPDGRNIAFVHNPPGEGDIWRMTWNGKNKTHVSHAPTFEFRPAWGVAP
jgi:Tol biopolymer transport system component